MMQTIKRWLPRRGARWIKRQLGVADMESRLNNLRRAGFVCTGAIDGGAYHGEWSRLAAAVFQCPLLAVEPQPSPPLEQLSRDADLRLEAVALGDTCGESTFMLEGTNSRIPSAEDLAFADRTLTVPVVDLKTILARHADFAPNLLKLDLQGGELKALQGAGAALHQFEVVICEVSVLPIGDVPRFDDINRFLIDASYRLYDFLPAYYRPLDGALWQADAFFVRSGSNLVANLSWQ